jgi:hypothetical protein
VNDLTEVVNTISEITSLPDYINNDNDQSVVEICITRVTSAIRYVDLCAMFIVIQIITFLQGFVLIPHVLQSSWLYQKCVVVI